MMNLKLAALALSVVFLSGCGGMAVRRYSGPEMGFLYGKVENTFAPGGKVQIMEGWGYKYVNVFPDGTFVHAGIKAGTPICVSSYVVPGAHYVLYRIKDRERWCFIPKEGEFIWAGAVAMENVKMGIILRRGEFELKELKRPTAIEVLRRLKAEPVIVDAGWQPRIEEEIRRLSR